MAHNTGMLRVIMLSVANKPLSVRYDKCRYDKCRGTTSLVRMGSNRAPSYAHMTLGGRPYLGEKLTRSILCGKQLV